MSLDPLSRLAVISIDHDDCMPSYAWITEAKRHDCSVAVKTFIGTSENALRIQIWTALIALLLAQITSHHLSDLATNTDTRLRGNQYSMPL